MIAALGRIRIGVRRSISANGGVEGAGRTTGKSKSLAGNWNNRNCADTPSLADAFLLDEVALEESGTAPIAAAFAAELGGVFIMLPQVTGDGDALANALIEATAEFGDVADRLREALRDGKLESAERVELVKEIDEAQAALARMRALAAGDVVRSVPIRGEAAGQ